MRKLGLILSRIFILLTIVSLPSFGQTNLLSSPGYIVINSDTIFGDVKITNQNEMYRTCSFRRAKDSFVNYSPQEIRAFYTKSLGLFVAINDTSITAKIGKKQGYFFQVLEKGTASLFKTQDETNKKRYFLQKDSVLQELEVIERITRAEDLSIKKTVINKFETPLKNAFKDCPQMIQKKYQFNEKKLISAFNEYNVCRDPVHPKPAKSQGRARVGLVSNFYLNRLTLTNNRDRFVIPGGDYLDLRKFKDTKINSFSVGGGLMIEFPLGNNQHWSIVNNVIMTSHEFENLDFKLKLKRIEIPLLLKYKANLAHSFRPSFGVGTLLPIDMNSQLTSAPMIFYDKNDKPTNRTTTPLITGSIDVTKLPVCGFVGFDLALAKTTLHVQYRLETVSLSNYNWADVRLFTNNLSLSFSIYTHQLKKAP